MKKKFAGVVLATGLLLSPVIASAAGVGQIAVPQQNIPDAGGPLRIERSGSTWTAIMNATTGVANQQHRAVAWDNRGSSANPSALGPWSNRGVPSRASIVSPHGTFHGAGRLRFI